MRVGEGIAVGHGMRRVVRMFIPLVVGLFCCSAVVNDLPFYFVFMFSCRSAAFNDFSPSSSVIRPPQFQFYKPTCAYVGISVIRLFYTLWCSLQMFWFFQHFLNIFVSLSCIFVVLFLKSHLVIENNDEKWRMKSRFSPSQWVALVYYVSQDVDKQPHEDYIPIV